MTSTEQGRVIVFTDYGAGDRPSIDVEPVVVFAVPDEWEPDDVDRFVKDHEPYWVSAAVVTVQTIEGEGER